LAAIPVSNCFLAESKSTLKQAAAAKYKLQEQNRYHRKQWKLYQAGSGKCVATN
jgi:hypothetical protein